MHRPQSLVWETFKEVQGGQDKESEGERGSREAGDVGRVRSCRVWWAIRRVWEFS